MIGTIIDKKNLDVDMYHASAEWCNRTQEGIIEDKGDYYEVTPNPYYESPELVALRSELEELKSYLDRTDYMVIKCMERGIEMKFEYPQEYVERQNARNRINEIRALLG